jgi:hypothetical protein
MKIEDQVVSLELSQRLKKLGVKQESLWYWNCCCGDNQSHLTQNKDEGFTDSMWSAFTVAELGDKFPGPMTMPEKSTSGIWCHFHGGEFVQSKTEADARAKMLIHLIENNLIDFNGLITSYPRAKEVK